MLKGTAMATTLPTREERRMAEPQRVGRGWDGPTPARWAIDHALSPPPSDRGSGPLDVIGIFASGRVGAWTR